MFQATIAYKVSVVTLDRMASGANDIGGVQLAPVHGVPDVKVGRLTRGRRAEGPTPRKTEAEVDQPEAEED